MATLLGKIERLQEMLLSAATGQGMDADEYKSLRQELLKEVTIAGKLPSLVKSCRDKDQFWAFIKKISTHWQPRREFLWKEFNPLIELLEGGSSMPSDQVVSDSLAVIDAEHIKESWTKALNRRTDDPEGAITAARTLLESVCKYILDESEAEYKDDADLPKLYDLTAKQLKLSPTQHAEQIFKQILGGCHSVVQGLGSLRNKLSDAHGKGKRPVKPAPRHAELAVNLAGSMALFLFTTWHAQSDTALHDM